MRRRRLLAGVMSAVLTSTYVSPAVSADAAASIERPAAKSDEGGLWMQSDENEEHIRNSPLLVHDPDLNAYVRSVLCKVAGARCGSLRVYIVKIPYFNAYAMPNGAVVIWTGLLLRVENEAQLAMVMGHEMTHFFNQHGLKNYESRRDTANVMAFVALGGIYALPILAIAGGMLQSYSRDQEREADSGGFDLATAAGYDPTQAGAIWSFMAAEDKAEPEHSRFSLFGSTHPANEERLATLSKRGAELAASGAKWTIGADIYRAHMAPFREAWLDDEVARGDGNASVIVLERLSAAEPTSGLLRYYLGESYRRRNQTGDIQRAVDAYTQAIACPDAPASAWRERGLLAMKNGDKAAAQRDFNTYLSHAPQADDRAMVQFYLTKASGT